MTEKLQKWIAVHGATPGLMACGIRPPTGKCTCFCLEELGPPEMMENLLLQFVTIKSTLNLPSGRALTNTWAFDRGLIRFVTRPDNWVFVIVVEVDSDALAKLDELSGPFLAADAA